jgi:F0F1-type ATP synthase delta subunit
MFIYVFICSLYADTVSNTEHVVFNDVIVNNELNKNMEDRVEAKVERELAT